MKILRESLHLHDIDYRENLLKEVIDNKVDILRFDKGYNSFDLSNDSYAYVLREDEADSIASEILEARSQDNDGISTLVNCLSSDMIKMIFHKFFTNDYDEDTRLSFQRNLIAEEVENNRQFKKNFCRYLLSKDRGISEILTEGYNEVFKTSDEDYTVYIGHYY